MIANSFFTPWHWLVIWVSISRTTYNLPFYRFTLANSPSRHGKNHFLRLANMVTSDRDDINSYSTLRLTSLPFKVPPLITSIRVLVPTWSLLCMTKKNSVSVTSDTGKPLFGWPPFWSPNAEDHCLRSSETETNSFFQESQNRNYEFHGNWWWWVIFLLNNIYQYAK